MGIWAQWIAFIMGRSAEAAAVTGVISAIVALSSYRKSVRDTNLEEEAKRMEASIRVLQIFSDTFVPQAEAYRLRFEREYQQQIQNATATIRSQNLNSQTNTIKRLLDDELRLKIQVDAGLNRLFNSLEQICVYIRNDLVREDIVYPAIHFEFLQFIDANEAALNYFTTRATPLNNLHYVIDKWQAEAEHDKISVEK